jgi:8-hydroxy-5-deazaflavin:NADPH oxidoreductase
MRTIGLIGSGLIGSTVARLAVAAGHDVVLSNRRGPETLSGLVAELGHIPELDAETATTSELLQAHLPESHIVKAMNNIFSVHLGNLARPSGDPEQSVLALAGDTVRRIGASRPWSGGRAPPLPAHVSRGRQAGSADCRGARR